MTKSLMTLFVALLSLAAASAQNFLPLVTTGSLTAASSSCLTTNCVQLGITSAVGTAAFQLGGTWVATVQFEGTVDGTNYVNVLAVPQTTEAALRVNSATANGIWQVNTAGYVNFRVRVSAYTSGTVTVTMRRVPVAPLESTT